MTSLEVIIVGHNEGKIIRETISSVNNAINLAKSEYSEVTLVKTIILDDPSEETKATIDVYAKDYNKLIVKENDLGLTRNTAVQNSFSEFICFIDGDDLMSISWILSCLKIINSRNMYKKVLHPQYFIHFHQEIKRIIFQSTNLSKNNLIKFLFFQNLWGSPVTAARNIFIETPYKKNCLSEGFAWEDWSWNRETTFKGFRHEIIPNSCYFIRSDDRFSLSKELREGWLNLKPHQEDVRSLHEYVTQKTKRSRIFYEFVLGIFSNLGLFLRNSIFFNKNYYLSSYTDLSEIRYPYLHFVRYGFREGRFTYKPRYVNSEMTYFYSKIYPELADKLLGANTNVPIRFWGKGDLYLDSILKQFRYFYYKYARNSDKLIKFNIDCGGVSKFSFFLSNGYFCVPPETQIYTNSLPESEIINKIRFFVSMLHRQL